LATHLLWFDAAGASSHGIATLATLLDRIDRQEIDPVAQGRAGCERAGTAVFDAQNGLALLALETAAGIASEKARDVGVGIVRVRNLGPAGPAAPVAADLAIGPFAAAISGPGPSLALALPSPQGLPIVFDSHLDPGSKTHPPGECLGVWAPWISSVAGDGGWLILALSVSSMESLSSFHERVASSFLVREEQPGQLKPESWDERRRESRERGVLLDEASMEGLKKWSERLQVPWPAGIDG
jgi:LDH2 family malate/lactate/ureidoglycolate dehydrogenase